MEPAVLLHDDPDGQEVTERTRGLFFGKQGALGDAGDPGLAEDDRREHAQPILVGEITEDAGKEKVRWTRSTFGANGSAATQSRARPASTLAAGPHRLAA